MTRSTLRILSTTDLHMQMTEHDYFLDCELDHGGMLQLASHINDLQSTGLQTILCDNGDFLQGNLLAEVLAEQNTPKTHPMIMAFNHLNYDAIVLGNHEFDFGMDVLNAHLDELDAPVLSANIRRSPKKFVAKPWTLVDRMMMCDDGIERPLRIGIIGFTPPQVVTWNRAQLKKPLFADDILAAALTHIPGLRREGAEIVIAMAHTGIGSDIHSYGMENAALPLARLRGIDALILGHSHEEFPNPKASKTTSIDPVKSALYDTPTIMAGSHAAYVGVLDLDLKFDGTRWKIADHAAHLHPNTPTTLDCSPKLRAKTKPALERASAIALARLNKPIAMLSQPINSYFSVIGHDPALRLIAQFSADCVAQEVQESEFRDIPLLGAAASFRAGGRMGPQNYINVSDAQLTSRHVSALAPFDNPLCVVLRRGWQLRHWLESISLFFNEVVPGAKDQFLTSMDFPSYHFDVIPDLEYEFDLSVPIRNPHGHSEDPKLNRLKSLKYQGHNVRDDELFLVTTSSYRALGGGEMGHVDAQDIILTTKLGLREMLETQLQKSQILNVDDKVNWRFTPVPDTTLWFRSNPNAVTLCDHDGVTPTGEIKDGYAYFDLKL